MVQFTIWWTDHFIWIRSKILSNIINRRRTSAPVRHKSRSSILHWIRIERGEKLEWWPFESGYRWSANNSTIWNSWKKIQHQRRRKEILNRNGDIVFPCKTDEIVQAWQPLSTAVYKAGSDPHAEISGHFFRRKRRCPRSRSRRRSSTIFQEHCGNLHIEIMLKKDGFPILSELHWSPETNENELYVLHEATIDDCWNSDWDKSFSDLWVGVTRFELLNKDPPEGHMWVQGRLSPKQVTKRPEYIWPDEWSNMSKNSCSEKPYVNGQKKNPNRRQRENDGEFPTEILLIERSRTTRGENWKSEEPERFKLWAIVCEWLNKDSNEKDVTLHVHSKIMRAWSLNRKEFEFQRVMCKLTKSTSRTEIKFLGRTTTWCTTQFRI